MADTGHAKSLTLDITASTGRQWVPFLGRYFRRAHALLPRNRIPWEISLALVGDTTMARLHEQFMHLPGPTDVLTFEMERDSKNCITSGQIVICVPEARRAAKRHGTLPRREVLLYAVHGLLHLSGFDDRTQVEFERMHQKEDELLARIGIGPVFAASRGRQRRKHS